MGYYAIVKNDDCFSDYVKAAGKELSLIGFSDDEKETVFRLVKESLIKDNPQFAENDNIFSQYFIQIVDENGIVLRVDIQDGKMTRIADFGVKRYIKCFQKEDARICKCAEMSQFIKSNFKQNTVRTKTSLIAGYRSFDYYDAGCAIKIRCAFAKARKKGLRPLFVYMHGAGAAGHDNLKQLIEYKSVVGRLKEDCYVLVPQCDNYCMDNVKNIKMFTVSVRNLIDKLAETYPIDKDRIYITGISYGGACVWYSLYNNPGFYAAGIPLMGYMPDAYSDRFEPERFVYENIWAAHSEDDRVVPIDSDLNIYSKIKDKCNVKFSVYKSGGHRMMNRFYRREKWQEWLFAHKKSKREE